MTVKKLGEMNEFTLVVDGEVDREIDEVYCCDLLSIVMGRAPANCAWVTVMGNLNSVAVAVLADVSCIVLAENISPDVNMINKAKTEHINILKTELPIFEAASLVNGGKNA